MIQTGKALIESRTRILQQQGACGSVVDELLAYNGDHLYNCLMPDRYPLPDEEFVPVWHHYTELASTQGVFSILRDRLVQLRFPISEGISQTPEYDRATRRGLLRNMDAGLVLDEPKELRLYIHPAVGGRIPILSTPCRADFVRLLRALTMRNEPVRVPDSEGASLVSGYNNWDRVASHRRVWERELGHRPTEEEWGSEFQRLAVQKNLYQDKFILMSESLYSGVSHESVGLSEAAWKSASLIIRREHECAHYLIGRVFPRKTNNLVDELVADYCGIVAAVGEYRPDWALRFLGLAEAGSYRAGARLENYPGRPPLSTEAFLVLQGLTRAAIGSLHAFWLRHSKLPLAAMALRLKQFTLEEVAEGQPMIEAE